VFFQPILGAGSYLQFHKTIFRRRFLAIVDIIRYQPINESKLVNGYVIRYHECPPTHEVVAMSYDSYQAKHGKAACLAAPGLGGRAT